MYSAIEVILNLFKTKTLFHPSLVEDAAKELDQLRDALVLGQNMAKSIIDAKSAWDSSANKAIEFLKKYPEDTDYARMLLRH